MAIIMLTVRMYCATASRCRKERMDRGLKRLLPLFLHAADTVT